MNWKALNKQEQIAEIKERSKSVPQLIFKHSTRCGTSSLAKSRLESKNVPESIEFYYLDVINDRSISNLVAQEFNVHHESPQVLLIKDGKCVYDESHIGIRLEDILRQAA
jgi:bacillithiol system protein YtxJ